MNKCNNLIFVNDDNEAAEVIFERLKDKLVPCKGQLFFKVNYIWISDSEIIKTHILDYILDHILDYIYFVTAIALLEVDIFTACNWCF